jgi:hypothetical protein
VRDEDGNILIYSARHPRCQPRAPAAASEKRQGAKSRRVGHGGCSKRYGVAAEANGPKILMRAWPLLGALDSHQGDVLRAISRRTPNADEAHLRLRRRLTEQARCAIRSPRLRTASVVWLGAWRGHIERLIQLCKFAMTRSAYDRFFCRHRTPPARLVPLTQVPQHVVSERSEWPGREGGH